MASHGVPRAAAEGQRSEKARQKELNEIKEYRQLVESVSQRIAVQEFNFETLALTSKVLKKNPEYYTMWNYRRRVLNKLLSGKNEDERQQDGAQQNAEELIQADLEFLLPLLMTFPKCYWIWNHRLWLLQQTSIHLAEQQSYKFWQQELALVAKMLSRDSRNYHGWSYRRTVIGALRRFDSAGGEQTESLTEQEFAYTTKMVRSNLSNFSAWHNRSKLIPQLLNEREAQDSARQQLFEEELTFVSDALSMDPNDQSLWYYHQFLISNLAADHATCFGLFSAQERLQHLGHQIELFREVLEDYNDCKWLYQNLLHLAEQCLRLSGHTDIVSRDEMQTWLAELQRLDPLRGGRWKSWEQRLGLL